jgi:hypothetical protein
MSCAALLLMESALRNGRLAGIAIFAGSLFFIGSDLRLVDTFTRKRKTSGVMETYALAQFLIAAGMASL